MDIDKKARARVFSPEMVGKVAKASLSTYEGKDQDDKAKWSSWDLEQWIRIAGEDFVYADTDSVKFLRR